MIEPLDYNIQNIIKWHYDRNLIYGTTSQAQLSKLLSEVSELALNIANGKDVRDDIGDIITVLVNIAERENTTIAECVDIAYNDIKDRTGQMIDGTFVKDK